MPSNPSEQPADSEQDRTDLTARPSQLTISAPPSRAERLQAWLLANGLKIEALVAAIAVGTWIVALPIVLFGTFTALGGDTSILAAGMAIVAVGLFGIAVLAAWSLAQILIEIRNHGVPFSDSRSTSSAAYDGIQSLKAVIAGTFLLALLTYLGLVLTVESGPTAVVQVLGVSGLLLPVVVFVHAVGAVVGSVSESG